MVLVFGALAIAYAYGYRGVTASIEGYNFQRNVEEIRKAATLEFLEAVHRQEREELRRLEGRNPLEVLDLEERPANYQGEHAGADPARMKPGSWWYDPDSELLIYRVEHTTRFRGGPEDGPGRVRLRLEVEPERDTGTPRALILREQEPYDWQGLR